MGPEWIQIRIPGCIQIGIMKEFRQGCRHGFQHGFQKRFRYSHRFQKGLIGGFLWIEMWMEPWKPHAVTDQAVRVACWDNLCCCSRWLVQMLGLAPFLDAALVVGC